MRAYLEGLVDGFRVVFIALLHWQLCFLKFQELAPEKLRINI